VRTVPARVLTVLGVSRTSRAPAHKGRSFWLNLGRALSWHRRKLAVLAAIGAVLTAVTAAAPSGPPTLRVVRAVNELASGAVVTAADVRLADVVEGALPDAPLTDLGTAVGRRLTGPVARDQVLTGLDLMASPGMLGPGRVIAPLRLADADVARLVQAGSMIDVIAADPEGGGAKPIAQSVRVLLVPARPNDDSQTQTADNGALILVDVDVPTATLLAQAAASSRISVVLRM
jgi:pilus assembly protein CpaB